MRSYHCLYFVNALHNIYMADAIQCPSFAVLQGRPSDLHFACPATLSSSPTPYIVPRCFDLQRFHQLPQLFKYPRKCSVHISLNSTQFVLGLFKLRSFNCTCAYPENLWRKDHITLPTTHSLSQNSSVSWMIRFLHNMLAGFLV